MKVRHTKAIARWLLLLLAGSFNLAQGGAVAPVIAVGGGEDETVDEVFRSFPETTYHWEGGSREDWSDWLDEPGHYRALQAERAAGSWFAAIVSEETGSRDSIVDRFGEPEDWRAFLEEADPLVEVWVRTAEDRDGGRWVGRRRLNAYELSALREAEYDTPTWITVTYRDPGGSVRRGRVEFGLAAAATAHEAVLAGWRQRAEVERLRGILEARDSEGRLSAMAQWEALYQAVREGEITLRQLPVPPTTVSDWFIAFDYALDERGHFQGFDRVYRESEIERSMRGGAQELWLRPSWSRVEHRAFAFQWSMDTRRLERCLNPLPGREAVQLRVENLLEPDPRRWNVLEFAAVEVMRQTALAEYGLIGAYLERERKRLALKRNTYDLFAEPAITAANVAGGLTGAGIAYGGALRLAYNLTVSRWFLPKVPTVNQLRGLLLVLAAKKTDPRLAQKAADLLSPEDLQVLEARAKALTDEEVRRVMESVTREDLAAMLSLARMQGWDARYRYFVDLLSNAAWVAGMDQETFLGHVLTNPYFSLSGELSIKNVIAAILGQKSIIFPYGTSLQDLADGEGLPKEWLQYFNVTVDVRALANTLHRLTHENLADRELRMPFPYAPRADDLAAYEVRVFGYPLLIYHKRGLMKDDLRAFEGTYAYTVLRSKVVEHFPTREDFEREIRARRVVPLGYVKVRGADGRLQDSSLAVFARIFPRGPHAGRTGIVLYGLRAFQDYSALIARERQRFEDYERLLEEGGVIERVVEAEDRERLPATLFEPVIFRGEDAITQRFATPLATLTELRRLARLRAWGQPTDPGDVQALRPAAEGLERDGFDVGGGEAAPFLQVDPWGSTYRCRQLVDHGWRTLERTVIVGPKALRRDLARIQEAREIEEVRRANLRADRGALIFLNQAVPDGENRWRVGPLLRTSGQGSVLEAGVLVADSSQAGFWAAVERLPVAERAGLDAGRFASLPAVLDLHDDGRAARVFVTVEYPAARDVEVLRQRSGRPSERAWYRDGVCRRVVSPDRIVVFAHDAAGLESGTRTYVNAGTLADPVRGEWLEATRTLEHRLLDPRQLLHDPNQPRRVKARHNRVLGTVLVETYGAFEQPLRVVDDRWIATNEYDAWGRRIASVVRYNGNGAGDRERPLAVRLLQPVEGPERFQLRPLEAVSGAGTVSWERVDQLFGGTNVVFYDSANGGRQVGTLAIDHLGADQTLSVRSTNLYRADFFSGMIPWCTEQRETGSDTLLATVEVLGYDPARRELRGAETDYTGKRWVKTWPAGSDLATRVESELRRTEVATDFLGLTFASRTVDRESGEELGHEEGVYDTGRGVWDVRCTAGWRGGLSGEPEEEVRSAGGRVLLRRRAGVWEQRSSYDPSGRLSGTELWFAAEPGGEVDKLLLQEGRFEWRDGSVEATVERKVDGASYDTYRTLRDPEGRLIVDGRREYPGLALWTELSYVGGTDRRREAREFQNGQLRVTRQSLPEQRGEAGEVVLPVRIVPAWGLVSTQLFSLSDPWGRPRRTLLGNGDIVEVQAWYPGTAIPRLTETRTAAGWPLERSITTLVSGEDRGIPCDRVQRLLLGPAGAAGEAAREGLARGSGVLIHREGMGRRVLMDLNVPYESPLVAVDPGGARGGSVRLEGVVVPHALAVLATRTNLAVAPGRSAPEPTLQQLEVDLEPVFYPRWIRREYDLAGRLLLEDTGRMPGLHEPATRLGLLAAAESDGATWLRRFRYFYDPGWVAEQADEGGSNRVWTFEIRPAGAGARAWPVNRDGERSLVSGIEGLRHPTEPTVGEGPSMDPGWVFRSLRHPRVLSVNPFLPGLLQRWVSWTAQDLDRNGQTLCESQLIYDAPGRLRSSRTTKRAHDGSPADRFAYALVEDELLLEPADPAGPDRPLALRFDSPQDWSGSDFVGWQVAVPEPTEWRLRLRDARGGEVEVGAGRADPSRNQLAFWTPNPALELWLPNTALPHSVSSVAAPQASLDRGAWVVVAVAELSAAGLEVRQVASVELAPLAPVANVQWSAPFHLCRSSPAAGLDEVPKVRRSWSVGADGFRRVGVSSLASAEALDLTGQQTRETILLNGRPVAHTLPPYHPSPYPTLVWVDTSDPELPRPLYAVASRDGHLLKHYALVEVEDATQLYTVVSGFETPLLEVFRRDVLGDEYSPGFLAYGYDYHASVRFQRGAGGFGGTLARIRNRIAANSFNNLGSRLARKFSTNIWPVVEQPVFDYATLHQAGAQAAAIARLPSLAEALLPYREPFGDGEPAREPDRLAEVNRPELRRRLLLAYRTMVTNASVSLERRSPFQDPPYLLPTSPGTDASRYIDTVVEAGLIRLAGRLGEYGLAGELLEFYRQKSQEGRLPLHASYDGETGAAMVMELGPRRPMHSQLTAAAQLALSEAVFDLALQTTNRAWFQFGTNLLEVLLRDYRDKAGEDSPLGITQHRALPTLPVLGLRLLPESDHYPVGLNARTFVLLRRFIQAGPLLADDPAWKGWISRCQTAASEQESWLQHYVVGRATEWGVVPSGCFEIQEVQGRTSALAPERWSNAEDWLDFIEAAAQLQDPPVPPRQIRRWLENLLRIHGARVQDLAGLDPGLPLLRPALLSADLTARLCRLGRELGHGDVVAAAEESLARLERRGPLPAVVSADPPPPHAVPLGQDGVQFPAPAGGLWPEDLRPYRHLIEPAPGRWAAGEELGTVDSWQLNDLRLFGVLAGTFYFLILVTALLWWRFRHLRPVEVSPVGDERLLSEGALQLTEERWARRVLGVQTPAGAPHTRFSNATLEQNFLMQLRALYKMVLEWRRQENGWGEDDRRLVEEESDDWINGMDEFASCVGLYFRYVIKAGRKDGLRRKEVLEECEDSNHIWSRLVMYLAEPYWGMLTLLRNYNNKPTYPERSALYGEISRLLQQIGVRQRPTGFDARKLFNYPAQPGAFDLLRLQQPGISLGKLLLEASTKLKVPYTAFVGLVEKYKAFKRREALDPVHPYLIEFAKLLPHFLLMGLGAVIVYNQKALADSPVLPYLAFRAADLLQTPATLGWALPLGLGFVLATLGHFVRIYRFEGSMLPREPLRFVLDETLTRLLGKKHAVMPEARTGWAWDPRVYEWGGWICRTLGWLLLGMSLLAWDTPSFATFLVVKGLLAMVAFVEAAAVLVPLAFGYLSRWLQDFVVRHPQAPGVFRFLNGLNFSPTRPASPLWLSLRYLTQPSVPSGDGRSLLQAILTYFGLSAAFFFVGVYLCQDILSLWFTENYLNASYTKLLLGGLVFWNTMYLLRYGLFLLLTALASLLCSAPFRTLAVLVGAIQLLMTGVESEAGFSVVGAVDPSVWGGTVLLLALAWFETPILHWWNRRTRCTPAASASAPGSAPALSDPSSKVGIVYMSGDDLGAAKLTPDLLMLRWELLRDRFDSRVLAQSGAWTGLSDEGLRQAFTLLHRLESEHAVTLWTPAQLVVEGQAPAWEAGRGLELVVPTAADRDLALVAWQVRRWLVTMMSTAGHSQDTAINLVDLALRMRDEQLATRAVFYLIQNKYDNRADNRPVQLRYDQGELLQREKLCRLLEALAPGARAFNVQNWTPFGFKAGGMTGMDLVAEENLRLRTLVVLDRNATVNDLTPFMADLTEAMADPNLVIVIPGRGTTNTLTPIGQGSQMIEEGHRSFLRGLMGLMGGRAGEAVGTGWGNVVTYTYGDVQRAMLDPLTPKMPLTSRMQRGASMQVRTEGMIGFAPHAVGISEDTWAVSQAMHNRVALGGRVRFRLSRAFWHKIRETWSHAEWLTSFPRWSGGYLQMMQDSLMQRINDFGPLSVFARELRAYSGRAYFTAPFALFNILFLPLAILMDVTPFVQILIVLWNFGFIMNQVLTLHGLNVYLESAGFSRRGAVLGMGFAAGAAVAWPSVLMAGAPGLVLVGLFTGGFWVGLSRWAYTRLRDMLLFGPQLILHALGQVMRQTIEFVISGASAQDAQRVNMPYRTLAGPREDQPLARFPHFLNLRTVVWCLGLPSVLLNLLALSNLDMFNVLLLLPSLLFSVSVFAGPFLMTPPPGRRAPLAVQFTRWLAWPAAALVYVAVSMMVARGGGWQVAAGFLALTLLIAVLVEPLRPVLFRWWLHRQRQALRRQLQTAQVAGSAAVALTENLLAQAREPARIAALLTQAGLTPEAAAAVQAAVRDRVLPGLDAPAALPGSRGPRWKRPMSAFRRTFCVALAIQLWFLVVPVPGLFVFAADDYRRTSLTLGMIAVVALGGVGVTLAGYWATTWVRWVRSRHRGAGTLERRAQRCLELLRAGWAGQRRLSDGELARGAALFTEFMTYLDQQSDAYARRCLVEMEQILGGSSP